MSAAIDALVRVLSNRLAGRRKSIDEQVEFANVIELLAGLKGRTISSGINGEAIEPLHQFSLKGRSPEEVIGFLTGKFQPSYLVNPTSGESYTDDRTTGHHYVTGRHRVYVGQTGSEKHYIHLEHGEVKGRIGQTEIRGIPFESVSLDFIVKAQK